MIIIIMSVLIVLTIIASAVIMSDEFARKAEHQDEFKSCFDGSDEY